MILGTFEDYTYKFYDAMDRRLMIYFYDSYKSVEAEGNAVVDMGKDVDAAIILEKDNKIIAASFLNVKRRPNVLLIHLIYVEPEFRNKHIHRTMHEYIDVIGKQHNKDMVVSTVHANNKVMLDYIVDKIGYEPFWHTFKRNLK